LGLWGPPLRLGQEIRVELLGRARYLLTPEIRRLAKETCMPAVTDRNDFCLKASRALLVIGAVIGLILGPSARASTLGTRLWLARYNGPGRGSDQAFSLAASPDGSEVFVTGSSAGSGTGNDYATLAYDASSGTKNWLARYNGKDDLDDDAQSLAVGPDGSKVFVTGYTTTVASGRDFATVSYDATNGAELWAKRYNGPASGEDSAASLAVSVDGSKVFVTGYSSGGANNDFATVAYDSATGAKLWIMRYDGPAGRDDEAYSVAVSWDGSKVFVTGGSPGVGTGEDYATVAYDASTGAELWAKRFNSRMNGFDLARSIQAGADGSMVFVTGVSNGDYGSVAYDASTGATLWVARYDGTGGHSEARSMAVSPDGSKVFVTGQSEGAPSLDDYATLAYEASTGTQLWAKRYDGPAGGEDEASAIAASPDGSKVFVTGQSQGGQSQFTNYATLAYDATNGGALWAKRYNSQASDIDVAWAIAVNPNGSKVFVTGGSVGPNFDFDYATLVYAA
jgi:hypothetical protein